MVCKDCKVEILFKGEGFDPRQTRVIFCPLHASAGKLLEAAQALCQAAKDPDWLNVDRRTTFIGELEVAINAAKGKQT